MASFKHEGQPVGRKEGGQGQQVIPEQPRILPAALSAAQDTVKEISWRIKNKKANHGRK